MLDSINHSLKSKWISSMDTMVPNHHSKLQDGNLSIKDLLVDELNQMSDTITDNHTLVEIVKRGLLTLSERERNIILLRYDVIQTVPNKEGSE